MSLHHSHIIKFDYYLAGMCLTHPTLYHLGNVLATLSDKRTGATFTPLAGGLTPGADARIDTWKPIVVSAHDYYPFGQYMPGRYSADTLSHCVATTFTGMGTVPYTVVITPPAAGDISLYGSAVVTYLSLPTVLHMVCTTATSGLFTVLPPVSAQGTHVLVDVGAITNNHTFTLRDNTTGIILGVTAHGTSTSAGLVSIALSPVPHNTSLSLSIECTDPTGGDLYCNGIVLPRDTLTAINIHGNVCSADAYQYGFNGQIKDNEWAGLGNHYEYGARNFDPRTGRFISVDPLTKKYPWYTPYQFAGNQPIHSIDRDGLEEYHAMDGSLIGKYGTNTEIRVVYDNQVQAAASITAMNTILPGLDLLDKANSQLRDNGSAPVYKSTDDAANGWGLRFNGESINKNAEYSSFIFITKINGKNVASYTEPEVGSATTTTSKFNPNKGAKHAAIVHSHGAYDPALGLGNNVFSTGPNSDIESYDEFSITGYVATPNGSLLKYNPGSHETSTLNTNMPSDPCDPTSKINVSPKKPAQKK